MYKKHIALLVFGAVFPLIVVPATHANSILAGAPNTQTASGCPCIYPLSLSGNIERAVQFSLSGGEHVTSIDVSLADLSAGVPVTLSLVSALTGPATTFGTFNFTTTNSLSDILTGNLNQNLAAGTYYLVLAGTVPPNSNLGWLVSDGTLTQNAGTVADGEWGSGDSGATWSFESNALPLCQSTGSLCHPGVFAVIGAPVAPTPEPASLFLMGSGLLSIGYRVRKGLPRFHKKIPRNGGLC
jgi:hypothetical protein